MPVHALTEAHDTPESEAWPPGALARGSRDQCRPFQRTLIIRPEAAAPVAMHACAELQETLESPTPPSGFGVVSISHRIPFQRSARAADGCPVDRFMTDPTAVHDFAVGQETLSSPG
jgi:hypothetical protein